MEGIRGRQRYTLRATDVRALAERHDGAVLDIGAGDGRFVRQLAEVQPDQLVIGVDTCRENMRVHSHRAPPNAVFVAADALALPLGLRGMADEIAINFPWGSLLAGLLSAHPGLMEGLMGVARPHATLTVRLNGGALAEEGYSLEAGAGLVAATLGGAGFQMDEAVVLGAEALRIVPSTWAKRLAFGRDPRGVCLVGRSPARLRVPA